VLRWRIPNSTTNTNAFPLVVILMQSFFNDNHQNETV
jgi:hypothetical protein